MYYNGFEIYDCGWEFDVEHAKRIRGRIPEHMVEADGLYHTHNFTIHIMAQIIHNANSFMDI